MSTVRLLQRTAAAALLLISSVLPALADAIGGFKNRLFAYPGILEKADGGAFLKIDYDNGRSSYSLTPSGRMAVLAYLENQQQG